MSISNSCKTIASLLCIAASAFAVHAQDGRAIRRIAEDARRVALVVGNDAYAAQPLQNAANDARDMGRLLEDFGFEVEVVVDASRKDFSKAVDRFADRLGPGAVGFFFYAGHGMQVDGTNYLIPTDYDGQDATDVRYDAYAASRVLDKMRATGSQLNVVLLDACRNNPYGGSRAVGGGLAQMSGGRGSVIAFATGPGQVAADNAAGRNGLFTHFLMQAMRQPGLELDDVLDQTRARVDSASGQRQTPWVNEAKIGDFYFTEVQWQEDARPIAPVGGAESLLEPPPPPKFGHLQIAVNAPRARVYVDGAYLGDATPTAPLNKDNFGIGPIAVRVEAEGYAPETRQVQLVASEWAQVVFSLREEAIAPVESSGVQSVVQGGQSAMDELAMHVSLRMQSDREQTTRDERGETDSLVVDRGPCGSGMVWVPAGEFLMGSEEGEPDETPVYTVNLEDYCIDQYEVSAAKFAECVKAGECRTPPNGDRYTWGRADLSNHPVNGVTHYMAKSYCAWAGKRLPTEAEWEKAARGTDGRTYPWGDAFEVRRANIKGGEDGSMYTAPVDAYPRDISPYGAYNMAGNVKEWVADKYTENYAQSREDYGLLYNVVRGGSWAFSWPENARVSNRYSMNWDLQIDDVGFRCAKSLAANARLLPIEPNQPTGATTILYEAATGIPVTLEIFDVAGVKVRMLVNGPTEGGVQSVQWDGRDDDGREVGSGIYFVRFQAGDISEMQKFSLLR